MRWLSAIEGSTIEGFQCTSDMKIIDKMLFIAPIVCLHPSVLLLMMHFIYRCNLLMVSHAFESLGHLKLLEHSMPHKNLIFRLIRMYGIHSYQLASQRTPGFGFFSRANTTNISVSLL